MACLANRDFTEAVSYASELAVVKAVVKQHQARVAADKAAEARRSRRSSRAPSQPAATLFGAPPCPLPGAQPSFESDYIDDYEAFNYMTEQSGSYAWAQPVTLGGATSSSDEEALPPLPSSRGASRPGSPLPGGAAARPQAPDFLAVLDAAQVGDDEQHLFDSYAMRHLILSRPAELKLLSGMQLGDAYVGRFRSTSLWGEACVLTVTLKQRSNAEQRSTYSKQPWKQPWVLVRVRGEPLSCEPLQAISPEHPPEAIVAAQLEALRACDFDVAYALTAPVGRAVAGTRDRFKAALQSDFRYQPLLMHAAAASVHRTHSNASTYLEVFSVESAMGSTSLFIFVATRQLEGLYKNSWLVECVTPVRDAAVIKALSSGH